MALKNMDWISVSLEEYKSLRAESISSQQSQQLLLRVGLATNGIVLSIGISNWTSGDVASLVLALGLPSISFLTLAVWIGEVSRMSRVGNYLAKLEQKINLEYQNATHLPLGWENWLRSTPKPGTNQIYASYMAIIVMFSGMGFCGGAIGAYGIINNFGLPTSIFIITIQALIIGGTLLFSATTAKTLIKYNHFEY